MLPLRNLVVIVMLVFGTGLHDVLADSTPVVTKKAFLGGQVPVSWSLYSSASLGAPTGMESSSLWDWQISYSIAQDVVRFGDTNGSQIDIYKMRGKDLDRVLSQFKKSLSDSHTAGRWSRERIDGRRAQVFTHAPGGPGRQAGEEWSGSPVRGSARKEPRSVSGDAPAVRPGSFTFSLDEGGIVSKGGTGGKMYFLKWKAKGYPPQYMVDYMQKEGIYDEDIAVVINKQALGDKEFEKSFSQFIHSMDLDDLSGVDSFF